MTGEDETNLVVTTLARFEFNVPRIIARVNNPKNAWLFNPRWVWMWPLTRPISWPS